jgi:subtilase family serine protease
MRRLSRKTCQPSIVPGAVTPGAFDTTLGGEFDAFVAKFGESTVTEPDLVVTAVTDPPAVLVLKQKFAVTDSTHNQGSASVATTTRYYLSADTVRNKGDKRLTGKRNVPALDAGATSTGTVNVTVPTTTKLGVYYLLACADDRKVETESDEGNNCRASTTTVEVRAPDLVETAVSNPPATATPGGSFSATDTVANQGNASAGLTTTRYYLSKDTTKTTTDRLLTGTRAVPGLAAGDNSTGTITVTIPTSTASATYYLLACGDDLKKVTESNEKNNCKASTTKVVVSP